MGKIENSKVTITDEELAKLESLASWLDGNATPEESEAIESDKDMEEIAETFEFVKEYESEIESLFGSDNYVDEIKMFETIFTSALRLEAKKVPEPILSAEEEPSTIMAVEGEVDLNPEVTPEKN
jgi:hypothetical protein